MDGTQNSGLAIVLAIIAICSAASTVRVFSKSTELDRGTRLRVILRRVSLILFAASGIIATEAHAGTVWERVSTGTMFLFVVIYLVFPLYSLVRLVLNGVRTKAAHRPGGH